LPGEGRPGIAYLGQPSDELVGEGLLARCLDERGPDVVVGRLPLGADETVLDVLGDGVVEQEGLLLDEADLRPPPLDVDILELCHSAGDPAVAKEEDLDTSACKAPALGSLFLAYQRVCRQVAVQLIPTLDELDYGALPRT